MNFVVGKPTKMKSSAHCDLTCQVGPSSEAQGMKKYKCFKPGRIVKNSFFNFLRDVRKSHCGHSPTDIVRIGAEMWRKMSEMEKCKYMQQSACAPAYVRKERSRRQRRRRQRREGGRLKSIR